MTQQGEMRRLSIEGRFDALRAPELDERLSDLHAAGAKTIVVDLQRVSYISSSALRSLLLAYRRQQTAGGQLILANTPERIMRVLRMAGFDRVFTFCDENLCSSVDTRTS